LCAGDLWEKYKLGPRAYAKTQACSGRAFIGCNKQPGPSLSEGNILHRTMCFFNLPPYTLPGASPTIACYNDNVVNFYNATGSLACFENKNISFYFEKRCSLLQRWRWIGSRIRWHDPQLRRRRRCH
jgi:hypothetical protein